MILRQVHDVILPAQWCKNWEIWVKTAASYNKTTNWRQELYQTIRNLNAHLNSIKPCELFASLVLGQYHYWIIYIICAIIKRCIPPIKHAWTTRYPDQSIPCPAMILHADNWGTSPNIRYFLEDSNKISCLTKMLLGIVCSRYNVFCFLDHYSRFLVFHNTCYMLRDISIQMSPPSFVP